MGALNYEPDRSLHAGSETPAALDRLARESAVVLAGETEGVFRGTYTAEWIVRRRAPKDCAQVSADKSRIVHGHSPLPQGYEHWMIKFANSQDPRDVGAIEYAYSVMAKDAGIDVPETHLFRIKKRAYFGVKRFDRLGDRRVHMHSLSGLIHADHRVPTLDYNLILRVVFVLTKNIIEVEKAYALACFSVLAHNRDDHAKNFSFLLDASSGWSFAPAYDLTFSDGPGGEQSTMVMGEGRQPSTMQLKALGKEHGLKNAPRILAKVESAVARWRDFAAEAGVTKKSINEIWGVVGTKRCER